MNQKRIFVVFLITSLALAVFVGHVLAVASPSTAPTPSATDDLLNTIHEEVQKRASEAQASPTNIGVVGTVSSISSVGDLIGITTVRQGVRSASISAQTVIVRIDANGARRQVKADDIKPKDNIIAMGQTDSGGQVKAKRIVLYVPENIKRIVSIGKVVSRSQNKLSIETLINKNSQEFTVNTDTSFSQLIVDTSGSGGKLIDVRATGFGEGDTVIVAASQVDGKVPAASLVVKLRSASPSPSPTPSAKK